MKKITLLLVIIFTFLFSTTSWGEWNFVTKTVSGDTFYYDKDRVRKSGKYIYFWMMVDYQKPKKTILSFSTYSKLDCSILGFKFLNYHFFKGSMGEGERITDDNPDKEWKYPPPNSSIELIISKVCEEHQKNFERLGDKKSGVLYLGLRSGKIGLFKEKWEGVESEDNKNIWKYEGEIKNELPNGQGTRTYPNGSKLIGEFKDGKMNGYGTLTNPDGSMYEGEWKNDKYNGQGIFTTQTGNKFEGEFKDSYPWIGTIYDKDGNIVDNMVNGEIKK